MSDKLNIILNGNPVTGKPGETILQLAQRHGISIPTLCHDPRLEPFSSCFVCVVEVEGMRGMQPSCSTRISEGMKVWTENEKVRKSRKAALDLLVSNHYADCMAPCKQTCPAGVDVQAYISFIEKGMYREAVEVIKETNPLPAVCGRVCVRPCEVACRRNLLDEGAPVGIDYLKRFAADQDLASEDPFSPAIDPPTGKKVAVIGAGPGGLSAAFFLQKKGHQADIFEAAPAAGGWLRYGIPEYRLPNDVLQKEVDAITRLGVNIFYNKKLGENLRYTELREKYDAVVLAIGSQKGTLLGAEGEDATGVYSGIDFLKDMEVSGIRQDFRGKKVAVVGGGNTAMDCCRTSLRCGADKVYVIYRRTEKEMPANPIEIHESKLEGVEYMFLTNPVKVNKNPDGSVLSVTCLKMELGEPDASGRRRPVPVQGSDFDVEVDVILAAIGQKTMAEFLEDVNGTGPEGELKVNRWGDLDADKHTLQTGVPSIFACGDGVTGPATLIEAVGQARIASRSCHQFLTGQTVEPERGEFLSRKENFRTQEPKDYAGSFAFQTREEMPTLDPEQRRNFSEVELGYASEDVAKHEANRCLECGCTEYYDCDLKRYATEYDAEQQRFEGEYKEYGVDFRHPYIEIDNNKCILCGRCVRICREVVGANALGFINRGFDTYVAPAMGDALTETPCESCGMCISACPTAAISENFIFKPGPVKLEKSRVVCNYCSVGCELELNHKGHFVMKVNGGQGLANPEGNLCRFGKFGYSHYNDLSRITRPMLREKDGFREISFEEASKIIAARILSVDPDQNAFFAGGRLTNEEMYLIHKLARAAVKTNNLGSFHYLGRGEGYLRSSLMNARLDDLKGTGRVWVMGTLIQQEHAVAGFAINDARNRYGCRVGLVTTEGTTGLEHRSDDIVRVNDYFYFLKAVNHYILSNGMENALWLEGNAEGFEEYRRALLAEDFDDLFEKAGSCCVDHLLGFAVDISRAPTAIVVFSEKELTARAVEELQNLMMLTGRIGKSFNGLLALKEKNNSHGLHDMGIAPYLGFGGVPVNGNEARIASAWGVDGLPTAYTDLMEGLDEGRFRNLFIFGEDPAGCAVDPEEVKHWLKRPDFIVVQDHFLSETAAMANLILPASFGAEIGGSYANAQKMIQAFGPALPDPLEQNSILQLQTLLGLLGHTAPEQQEDIRSEFLSLLPTPLELKLRLRSHEEDDGARLFDHGCDLLEKRFEEEFTKAFDRTAP
jgi:formate dehydrogenase major subunit